MNRLSALHCLALALALAGCNHQIAMISDVAADQEDTDSRNGLHQEPVAKTESVRRPVVDLSRLTSYESEAVGDENHAAYAAINAAAKPAGFSWRDPATNVLTTRLTDGTGKAPARGNFVPIYSTMGLAISPCWGEPCVNYTIWFHEQPSAADYFVDYTLGGAVSNYRAGPASEARGAFLRNEDRTFLYTSGRRLDRYDAATDRLDNRGGYPYRWATDSIPWFHCNEDDTYCIAMARGSTDMTTIDLRNGDVKTVEAKGMDEPYIAGTVPYAFSGAGNPEECWQFLSGEKVEYSNTAPRFDSDPFHTHGFRDFVHHVDVTAPPRTRITKINLETCRHTPRSSGIAQHGTNDSITLDAGETYTAASKVALNEVCITAGAGVGQCRRIARYDPQSKVATLESSWNLVPNSTSRYEIRVYVEGYPNDIHTSMHWTDPSNGGSQGGPYALWSNNRGGSFTHPSWSTAVFFVNLETGAKTLVGHTYNRYRSGIVSTYIDEAHCTISKDGVLVICGTNWGASNRHDVIVFELPHTME